jgi:GxxExxY protein
LLVQGEVIVELKSVDEIKGIYEAQILTYMKLAGVAHGLLINFNVEHLMDGLKSYVL